jgi:hypothetical protein
MEDLGDFGGGEESLFDDGGAGGAGEDVDFFGEGVEEGVAAGAAGGGGGGGGGGAGGAAAVKPEARVTTKFMTKYEKARILGTRALQLRCVFFFFWPRASLQPLPPRPSLRAALVTLFASLPPLHRPLLLAVGTRRLWWRCATKRTP